MSNYLIDYFFVDSLVTIPFFKIFLWDARMTNAHINSPIALEIFFFLAKNHLHYSIFTINSAVIKMMRTVGIAVNKSIIP